MTLQDIVVVAVLLMYNGATIRLLMVTLKPVNLGDAVAEKSLPAEPPKKDGDGAKSPAQPPDTSYSRVTGMIGAVVLATLFWGGGNVVLWMAFNNAGKIGEILSGVGTLFASGAALFLPYGFNQVREAFAPRK